MAVHRTLLVLLVRSPAIFGGEAVHPSSSIRVRDIKDVVRGRSAIPPWVWREWGRFATLGQCPKAFLSNQFEMVTLEDKQAIAGVTPSQVAEAEIMTVWPSISAYPSGQMLGRLYDMKFPNLNRAMRIGNLIAVASIPHALFLYFFKLAPRLGMRYKLTNRRVVVLRGIQDSEKFSVALDNFDDIKVEVQDGQEWFKAGDLIFLSGNREVFRLSGVSRPEAFRSQCLKAHIAFVGIKAALAGRA